MDNSEDTRLMEAAEAVPSAPTFFIELEDDPVKNDELGELKDPLGDITNLQAGDEKGSQSYLSIICSTIQVVKPGYVLLVWHTNFHPATSRRFKHVSITCNFLKALDLGGVVSITGHAPRKAYGGCSKESRSVHWGLEMPLSFPAGPISVGFTPSRSLDIVKDVEHAFTITGTARGVPTRTRCVWTIEEDSSTKRGIPSEIQFATILQYEQPFVCEVVVSGRTGGMFPRWLRTRTPATERQRAIDPQYYKGLLKEYDLQGDLQQCTKMLQEWTGEVEGAVVQFSQPVVKP